MLYSELLRITVLLIGGVATALGAVSVIAAQHDADSLALIVGGAWWLLAGGLGLALGRSGRVAQAISRVLAGARTATSLPPESPAWIAFLRLWPVGAFALICGGLAWIWPQIAAIGAGYAILTALSWRGREGAVQAIEDRDGVRFYVEPSSALEPVRLVRTPGLYRDRSPTVKPPPPQSA